MHQSDLEIRHAEKYRKFCIFVIPCNYD